MEPLTDDDGELRELTEEELNRFRPAAEVLPPELFAKLCRGKRPVSNSPDKPSAENTDD